jgi:hypothetical protein
MQQDIINLEFHTVNIADYQYIFIYLLEFPDIIKPNVRSFCYIPEYGHTLLQTCEAYH